MPGLVGCISIDGTAIDTDVLSGMAKAITHRPWYRVESFRNEAQTVGISVVQSVILTKENQPFCSHEGRVKIFLHGEITNDEAFGKSPLEFIYLQYERRDRDFAAGLIGSFVIIIVDEDKHCVWIATDKLSSRPCFYLNDGRTLYFSPEMKSLFLVPSLQRKLNWRAIGDFLARGHFTLSHTFVEGIQSLEAATVVSVANQQVGTSRYWQWAYDEDAKDLGSAHYQEALTYLLRQSIRRSTRSAHSYGVLLSGGYDSRGILGAYLEQTKLPPRTISWGRAEDIAESDCLIARQLAESVGARHSFFKLSADEVINGFREFVTLNEGLTWFAESFDVFHRIRQQEEVDVLLRGDECFGYSKELEVHDNNTMLRVLNLNKIYHIPTYQKILKPSYYKEFCEYDRGHFHGLMASCGGKSVHDRLDTLYLNVRLRYFLNPLNYVKTLALECSRPLLDYGLLEFMQCVPKRYRVDKTLWRETVVGTYQNLGGEFAKRRNDIDWGDSFERSPEIKRFIYQQLIVERNAITECLDVSGLKVELDKFFARPLRQSSRSLFKQTVLRSLRGSPSLYKALHKSWYSVKGLVADPLPLEYLILRLLILKTWGDVFLNYPTTENRAN